MYTFTADGEFFLFDIDIEHKTLKYVSKRHIDDPPEL
jgi:hypothetical protein